jgi:hypothetical protein
MKSVQVKYPIFYVCIETNPSAHTVSVIESVLSEHHVDVSRQFVHPSLAVVLKPRTSVMERYSQRSIIYTSDE